MECKLCRHGMECRNIDDPDHCAEFCHEPKPCRNGAACTDFSDRHRYLFWHPAPPGKWQTSREGSVWVDVDPSFTEPAETALSLYESKGGDPRSVVAGCKIDLKLMSSKRGTTIVLLRRLDEVGNQTHPPPDAPHPFDTFRIERIEKKGGAGDWLTNDFFFEAFCKAVAKGGGKIDFTKEGLFDFRYSQDCRDWTSESTKLERRGGVLYRAPYGWKRFALNVKKPGEDEAWMGMSGRPGEWAVAYHGTDFGVVPLIVRGGFKIGKGCGATGCPDVRDGTKVKDGVYCTPNLHVVECYANGEEHSKPCVELDGRKVFFAFQCRVNPACIRRPIRHFASNNDEEQMGIDGTFEWVIEDPSQIRPYAILVREHSGEKHETVGELVKCWNSRHSPLPAGSFDHV
mmetsp:Transcript_135572/g.234582  ORF Transcript_135572/g.234582 Transcript_135572/m.234582 type:complete len:400 (+) Transcript_135572:81-1280(+)